MTTYSRYWRKHRSRREAEELALGLRALRKVAGHLGGAVKPVFWKGMVDDNANAVIVDPGNFQGRYPMPHSRFDLAVGQVVAEGLASQEWSEWVSSRVFEGAGRLSRDAAPYLEQLVKAAEDIYIHSLPKAPAWDMYLEGRYEKELNVEARDPALPPSAESLAHIWRQGAILKKDPGVLHFYYELPLAVLEKHTEAIREIAVMLLARSRREARTRLYLDMWGTILSAISEWESFETSPDAVGLSDPDGPEGDLLQEEKQASDDPEDDEDGKEEDQGLDQDLSDEVNQLLEDGESNVTKLIAVAVEDPQAGNMKTIIRPGAARSDVRPDPEQVGRLNKIFREQEAILRKLRRRRVRRGLSEGKLDPRRLYRVPLDGKVFKIRDAPGTDKLWHICVVADASSSMSGKGGARKPWPTAEKVFASLAAAAENSRNRLDIFSYNEEQKKCVLTRLNHSDELFTVIPEGRTPSGQAITAAAMTLRKECARTMIIHITDGASNCGMRLGDAVKFCKARGIEAVTIGCGCNRQTKDFLAQYFEPENLFFMNSIQHLSLGMERLLKRKMLLQSNSGNARTS